MVFELRKQFGTDRETQFKKSYPWEELFEMKYICLG